MEEAKVEINHEMNYTAAFKAGKDVVKIINTEEGKIPIAVIPKDMKVESLQEFAYPLPTDPRDQSGPHFTALRSFVEYVNKFKLPNSLIFASMEDNTIIAELDYHTDLGNLSKRDHKATFSPSITDEWKDWTDNNGERMDQMEFIEFLDEHLPDIAEPAGAKILEACRSLEAIKTASFKSAKRLDNGETQFEYTENLEGQGARNLQMFNEFTLGLQPFKNMEQKYQVKGVIRYRLRESELRLFYKLERVAVVLDAAFNDFLAVVEAETGIKPLFGVAK